MNGIVIKAENISKLYNLGGINMSTLKADINRYWAKYKGKEDPRLALAESNDRTKKGDSQYVWALKNINFDVHQGDVLGIIGRNGAGKSTLLKVLSKVTSPTTGSIKVKGRIASLLEVGTGFHPELTGRENVYLNGHILGMRKPEIDRNFDAIVDFAGVEKYLDTAVKKYSSGMYVRLAFAVAAHLEPEILIVDEVLAVGDVDFQKKCMGKMNDISKVGGRTILFVSHNMAAIEKLCNKGIVIEKGESLEMTDAKTAISNYLSLNSGNRVSDLSLKQEREGNGILKFRRVALIDENQKEITELHSGKDARIRLFFDRQVPVMQDLLIAIGINDLYDQRISFLSNHMLNYPIDLSASDPDFIDIVINKIPLVPGSYSLTLFSSIKGDISDWVKNAFYFEIHAGDFYDSGREIPYRQGTFLLQYTFKK
jgi:lipopolysaccharide transport system ATP-binding protein